MDTTSPAYRYAHTSGRLSAYRQLRAELQAAMQTAATCLPPAAYAALDAFEARVNAESEAAMDAISYYPAASPTI